MRPRSRAEVIHPNHIHVGEQRKDTQYFSAVLVSRIRTLVPKPKLPCGLGVRSLQNSYCTRNQHLSFAKYPPGQRNQDVALA